MKIHLIDTQIAIWALENNIQLSEKIRIILENQANIILLSQVSLFEITIKQKVGKLPNVPFTIIELIDELDKIDIQILPISNLHFNTYNSIELFEKHRDPFDRLILATALYENIPIISADEKFKNYKNSIELIDNQN